MPTSCTKSARSLLMSSVSASMSDWWSASCLLMSSVFGMVLVRNLPRCCVRTCSTLASLHLTCVAMRRSDHPSWYAPFSASKCCRNNKTTSVVSNAVSLTFLVDALLTYLRHHQSDRHHQHRLRPHTQC